MKLPLVWLLGVQRMSRKEPQTPTPIQEEYIELEIFRYSYQFSVEKSW